HISGIAAAADPAARDGAVGCGEVRMKIVYDAEVDALSITFRETTVTTKHLDDGIAADYDADGKLAGIEILDVSRLLDDAQTFTYSPTES
ncbi:MAG TPA: DUF2283 domain-containing protein, partial [Longimicrobiaceae bacterium]|nr:DUF2283 domain-containing protein [Longimicrobiaceae bacterium]